MALVFDVKDLQLLGKRLEGFNKHKDDIIKKVMVDLAVRVISRAKRITPVDTGVLRRSFENGEVSYSDGCYSIDVKNSAEYALFVEEGHRIVSNGVTVGWKSGVFMLKIAESKVKSEMDAYVKRAIEAGLRDVFL